MLEQRIQQQFFDSADLQYAAAEVLPSRSSTPSARSSAASPEAARCWLRQRRLGRRRAALRRRVRRPLRARAAGAGGDRADRRHLDPHGDRQRLRLRRRLLQAGRALGAARRRASRDVDERQLHQRAGGDRGRARAQGDDRDRAHRQHRRQDPRATDPRPTFTSAFRTSGPRASRRSTCWCCTACATRSTCNCSAKRKTHDPRGSLPARAVVLVALAATLLAGCAPLLIGGAVVGGALVATDRRTSGAQVDDEVIELKAKGRLGERSPTTRARVNATSYNRHGPAHRPGAERRRQDDRRAGGRAHRQRRLGRQRARPSARSTTFGERTRDTFITGQGQGEHRRRQGPVRAVDQGRDAPRRRLPDGPRHRTRGEPRRRDRARRQRRRQGREGVRYPHRGRARQHRGEVARQAGELAPEAAAQRKRRSRLDVSLRLPPIAWMSA